MARVPFMKLIKTIGNSIELNAINLSEIEKNVIGKNMKEFSVKFDIN